MTRVSSYKKSATVSSGTLQVVLLNALLLLILSEDSIPNIYPRANSKLFTQRNQEVSHALADTTLNRQALAKVFVGLNGSSWSNGSGWLFDASVCFWHGIRCSGMSERRLVSLDLRLCGLHGQLPSLLGVLTSLRVLRLADNSVSGTIPPGALAKLDRLELLGLQNNSLTGSLPHTFGYLKSLRWAGLWDNAFTGAIPRTIEYLMDLQTLYLDGNQLSGAGIPDAFGALTALTHLNLRNNSLNGTIPSSLIEWATQKDPARKCNLSIMNFSCPLPHGFKAQCKAVCVKEEDFLHSA